MKPKTIEIRCDLASAVRAAKRGMKVHVTGFPAELVVWKCDGEYFLQYSEGSPVGITEQVLSPDAFTVIAPVDPKCAKCRQRLPSFLSVRHNMCPHSECPHQPSIGWWSWPNECTPKIPGLDRFCQSAGRRKAVPNG